MITGRQIKAARALLAWEQKDLAKASGINVRTIRRLEAAYDKPKGHAATLQSIEAALTRAGIEFLYENAPGVRHHPEADASNI